MRSLTVDWAVRYIERYQLALVEIPLGRKSPLRQGWNRAEGYITETGAAREHWTKLSDDGIGVVLGASGLCSLDVDNPERADPLLTELGVDIRVLRESYPIVQGDPDRYRILFRVPEGLDLRAHKLVWPANDGAKPITVFELRAGPVQDVLPPTIHPSTGEPYRWLVPPGNDFPPPPPALLELWQSWPTYQRELEGACPWAPCFSPDAAPRGSGARADVIGAFNQARGVEDLLKTHGYKPRGKRWVSPTSESDLAGVVCLDDGRVFSHHASDPLADGHSHDAFDLYRILEHGGDTKAAIKAAAEALGIGPEHSSGRSLDEWPEPQPLPSGLPAVEPFEPELLPAALRPWIEDISDRIQCPPDFPAIGAMVVLASVVGRKVGIKPKRQDDWGVIPNLWGGVVGRPGILKTPPLIEVKRPLDRLEIEAKKKYEEAVKSWQANEIIAKETMKVTAEEIRKRLKKGGDIDYLARNVIESDAQKPQRRRFLVNDSSVEKIGEILSANPNGVLIFRDELTGFLRSLEREGQEGARAFYLEAWNGIGRFSYDRIGRGTVDIEACCVSILGGIQPGPLGEYLRGVARGGVGDDGLMQRFQLLVWPDPSGGEWRNVDRWPKHKAKERAYAVFARLDSLDIDGERDDDSNIPFLRFNPKAQGLFVEWRGDLENRLRTGELPETLESHLAKYRSLIPTFALLIHLVDVGRGRVGLKALERACGWGDYLESHAGRVYSPVITSDIPAAKALLGKILAGELGERFTLRDVYRPQWSGLAQPDDASRAVGVLLEFDWLRAEDERTAGRPRTWYRLNPRAKS